MTARRPALIGGPAAGAARAAVLLLPGGSIRSRRPPSRVAELGLAGLRRRLGAWSESGLSTYLVRYRYRGWYAGPEQAATATDTRWALGEIRRRHPGVPVILVGNSLGGRAAVELAGDPSVTDVVGVAPWLPADADMSALGGRRLLIVHGSADRSDAPALWSLAFAERARAAGVPTARLIVPGDGHFLLRRQRDWSAAVADFVAAAAGLRRMPGFLTAAFDVTSGLSQPLPVAR